VLEAAYLIVTALVTTSNQNRRYSVSSADNCFQ